MKQTLLLSIVVLYTTVAAAQNTTVGVINHNKAASFQGYTLFAPVTATNTYLIDNDGYVVKVWSSANPPGQAAMLLNDGTLLRTGMPFVQAMGGGGAGGIVEKIAWDGMVTWRYEHYGATYRAHHDVEIMPNGNVLLLVWESHTIAEAIEHGRDATRLTESALWSERIIEVQPTGPTSGQVVWSWSSWDHMIQDRSPAKPNYGVVSEHPERIDINSGDTRSDWLHMNSVRYNAKRNEVMVSVHNLHEFWVISRTTGDIVYRWGNPQIYKRGVAADRRLFGQHDARWIDEDGTRISVFNNGQGRLTGAIRNYSTVEELNVPLTETGEYANPGASAYGPSAPSWIYPQTPSAQYFATNISGATRIPNGNVLTCLGPQGTFVEVTDSGQEVWRYINPVGQGSVAMQGQTPRNNMVFKIYRYPRTHPGLADKSLTPKGRLEEGPLSVEQEHPAASSTVDILGGRTTIHAVVSGRYTIDAYDLLGRWLGAVVDEILEPGTHVRPVPEGTFVVRAVRR